MDAARTGQTVTVNSQDETSPYRLFGRIAARQGVHHTIAVGLPLTERTIGALNMYRADPTEPARPFLKHAEDFARYAAVTVHNVTSYANLSHDFEHLQVALQSRAVIEQAKGLLMARDGCTADEAFDRLRRISQNSNIKLHQLAQDIVDAASPT